MRKVGLDTGILFINKNSYKSQPAVSHQGFVSVNAFWIDIYITKPLTKMRILMNWDVTKESIDVIKNKMMCCYVDLGFVVIV